MNDPRTPEPWRTMLARASIGGQRALATKAGVSPATINRLVHGVGRPDAGTVRAVAEHLTAGDTNLVWDVIGTGQFDYGDFPTQVIEDDLRLLTPTQRAAVIALVRSMADPKGKVGTDSGTSAKKSVELKRDPQTNKGPKLKPRKPRGRPDQELP